MLSSRLYSVKDTSSQYGINLEENTKYSSLKHILENIKNISNNNVEMSTSGPSGHSIIYTNGKIKQPAANGHLILNPSGIDLRVIPGKIKNVNYEKISDNRYKANLMSHDGNKVLSLSFYSKEDLNISSSEISSLKSTMKTINKSNDIENLWRNMADVHHFYSMLQQLGISKLEAFQKVPNDLARKVSTESLLTTLNKIHNDNKKMMIFVGNDSAIQIYTGPIDKITEIMNGKKIVIHGTTEEGGKSVIRIAKDEVGEAWVVNKNSRDGFITSLELFNKNEEHIAQFYGVRREGQKQDEYWGDLMRKLPNH
nr:hypothetical protein [Providencia rettgeri]